MKDLISILPDHTPALVLLKPDALWDARAKPLHEASLLLSATRQGDRLIQLLVRDLGRDINPPRETISISLPGIILLPGFVNAHTHLDLTALGPQLRPDDSAFAHWLDHVRTARPQSQTDIAASVRTGIALSLAGGVVALGDIAGCTSQGPTLTPWRMLSDSPLAGVSFVEFFAMGDRAAARIDQLEQVLAEFPPDVYPTTGAFLGLSPHAPYSVEPPAYQAALRLASRLNLPLTTHLAETHDERMFIQHARGPHRDFLEQLGLYGERMHAHFGLGLHPVEHLAPYLSHNRWLCAHCNDTPDHAIAILASARASVVYCPRASTYFGNSDQLGLHRYRDMLAAGINVCLGTDSIMNLPQGTDDPAQGLFSTRDEARVLIERDDLDPQTALAMLTTRGAAALGLNPEAWTFTPGAALAGIVALPMPATPEACLTSDAPPQLLAICSSSVHRA